VDARAVAAFSAFSKSTVLQLVAKGAAEGGRIHESQKTVGTQLVTYSLTLIPVLGSILPNRLVF
jgi:hypothetical protein